MKNYDDIKRFKEKAKMESIDYKEITENEDRSSMQGWAIIKQVSASDEAPQAFDNGRTTQPTPSPISGKEFNTSSFLNAVTGALPPKVPPLFESPAAKPATASSSPLFQAINEARPAQAPPTVAQTYAAAPQNQLPPVSQPSAQADDQSILRSRYKNMFKQKVPQQTPGTTADPLRDIPLQPLLEMIASCR